MRKTLYFLLITLASSQILKAQSSSPLFKVKINGFGDIEYGQLFGSSANKTSANLFQQYGDKDQYPTAMHKGFTSHGADFLGTVSMRENFKFQTEVNVEGERGADGGGFELEVERLYVDYSVSEKFGVQAGYMFTPIGYINRYLYSRAWLMNSVRLYQAVEPSAGYIPTHFMGATIYGNFATPNAGAISYIVGYGKARDLSPSNEDEGNDRPGYQSAGLIEWHLPCTSDFRIAVSGFTNEIHTYNVSNYGDIVNINDSSASPLLLQETGFNPYIYYSGKKFSFLAEYDYVYMHEMKGDYQNRNTSLNALSSEFALNLKVNKKKFSPYVRYDFIFIPPNGGPYYGLRKLSDEELTKVYLPEYNAIMVGVAYDLSYYNRIKLEYIHHFDGPTEANGIFLQTAFGF